MEFAYFIVMTNLINNKTGGDKVHSGCTRLMMSTQDPIKNIIYTNLAGTRLTVGAQGLKNQ